MHVPSIIGAGLLLLLSGAAASANEANTRPMREPPAAGVRGTGFGLSDLFRRSNDPSEAPVRLAQASDPRVMQLEEEIRKLSGTVEELNFQILQMQEQLRKMQEDNEFRFQQLEGGGASAGSTKKSDASAPAKGGSPAGAGAIGTDETTATVAPPVGSAQGAGLPGVNLGTMTVDKDGNISGTTLDGTAGANASKAPPDNATVASLPSTDDPDELYRNAYEFILSGDYATAESGFRDHISRFPADPKTADARYWLGESLLGQKKYRDAAETFLNASKEYPDSAKAPDMLLKLGVSLEALDQRDVACATFKEVGKRYPNSSDALKKRLKQEQALAAC